MTLQIQTEFLEPTTLSLSLDGKLDTLTAPKLEDFISKNLNQEIKTIVMDLQKLSFVSSAGLRVFAKIRKTMKSKKGEICFVNLSPQVKKVFDIVKAVPISEVFQSTEELDNYLKMIQEKAT